MLSRAEQLATTEFINNRFAQGHFFIGELATGSELRHGVLLDTEKNTLYCTCPFYPKPCIHAQAFALLYKQEGIGAFEPADTLPAWAEMLRNGQAARVRLEQRSDNRREEERQRRHASRLDRAARGFEDLEAWLLDTLRRGLATAVSEDPAFYQTIAARLADASMRGLSRNLRMLEAIPTAAADWADRTVAVLADAALALRAFKAQDQLPEPLLYDLEAYIGIAPKKDWVLEQGEKVNDAWAVTGRAEETVEAQLQVRRTWLLGAHSRRFALLLDYSFGDAEFPPGFSPGTIHQGTLVFYPSAWPLRALVPDALAILPKQIEKLPGYDHLDEMASAYAKALGTQPWLAQFPAVLSGVIPFHRQSRFGLADPMGKSIPFALTGADPWSLIALSGGYPLTVFGEWDGERLLVLSALSDGRLVQFPLK